MADGTWSQETDVLVPRAPGAGYRFSAEELKVLQECNRESFYSRSLPIGSVLGMATFAATQTGYLRVGRFGPFPKVTLAVAVGYFVGKISYQQACAEKLMALPNSYIGQLLRDRRDGKATSVGGSRGGGGGVPLFGAARGSDVYSDAGPESALDLDTTRPTQSDDIWDPNKSALAPPTHSDAASSSAVLTYEELRNRNRQQHTEARQNPYRVDPIAPTEPALVAPSSSLPRARTNQYGDEMD